MGNQLRKVNKMSRYFVEIKLLNHDFNVGWYIDADSVEDAMPQQPFILPNPNMPDYKGYNYDIEVTVEPTE
tara:strand:- start:1302 stop:1514 length:213 start_codon:yes stop_codon:yes gene_type:complete